MLAPTTYPTEGIAPGDDRGGVGGGAAVPTRYQVTARSHLGFAPWEDKSYTYSILQIGNGSNSISKLEVVSQLNVFSQAHLLYHYNPNVMPKKYAAKVYLGTFQTMGKQWVSDENLTIKNWPNSYQANTQKGEASFFKNKVLKIILYHIKMLYNFNMNKTLREETNKIILDNKALGGSNDVLIQTMSNIKTSKIEENKRLLDDLTKRGCDLLRFSVLDKDDVLALKELVRISDIPLVADLHFNKELMLETIKTGVSKIRLNPGNITKDDLVEVIKLAKTYNTVVRIGLNSGCLDFKRELDQKSINTYFKLLDDSLNIFKELDYDKNIVLSLKSTDPLLTIRLNEIAANIYRYPIHIGITETGQGVMGMARSCAGLVPILEKGIGNTIRISLSDNPQEEIEACKALLKAMNIKNIFPTLISCPTCGRTTTDLFNLTKKVNNILAYAKGDFKVAVMGCAVNGPGEAKDADIGLSGCSGSYLVFEKGKTIGVMSEIDALEYLKKKIAILSGRHHINKM